MLTSLNNIFIPRTQFHRIFLTYKQIFRGILTQFDVLSRNITYIYDMSALRHPLGIFIMPLCVGNTEKKQLFELMIALFACYFYPDLLLDP